MQAFQGDWTRKAGIKIWLQKKKKKIGMRYFWST